MKKIVIIGGGIAGLSAGIFAQKNGFESIILEKHHTLGGECTGWDRQGYHIDGCIHWLVGTKDNTAINKLWKTVGALDGVDIYNPESFLSYEHPSGTVDFYRDLERLESSWIKLAPQDKHSIKEFCEMIKKLHGFEIPCGKPMDMMRLIEKVKLMLSMKDAGLIMQKYGKISLKDYAKRFNHPALHDALATFLPEGYSASSLFFALGSFTKGQASVPSGGSKALAMRMVDRYLSLGGKIESSCEVIDVNIKNKEVREVICKNGNTYTGEYYLACCDAHVLYEKLLSGKYSDRKYEKRYDNPKDYPLASEIRIALGYEGTLEDFPRTVRFPINSFEINSHSINDLLITHYNNEKNFAPSGHTLITCSINQFYDDYDAWHKRSQDTKAYKKEKNRIGQKVIKEIESKYPWMKDKLQLLDVATPKTFERYTNAYRGSFMGFLPTTKGKQMAHTGKIKGLKNIFLSGQWLQPPGGLPVALITGKDSIMRLCKKEKKSFIN